MGKWWTVMHMPEPVIADESWMFYEPMSHI